MMLKLRSWNILVCIVLLEIISNTAVGQIALLEKIKSPRGKIKSYVENWYDLNSGSPVLIRKSVFSFHSDGRLKEKQIHNTIDSSLIDQTIQYIFEDTTLVTEKGNGYNKKYVYDISGNPYAMKYSSDSLNYLIRYSYNSNRFMEHSVCYNDEGKLLREEKFINNDQGKIISKQVIIPDTPANSSQTNFSYDTKGNTLTERVYATNEHIKFTNTYTYDELGNMIEQRQLNENGTALWRANYKYRIDKMENWVSLNYQSQKVKYLISRFIQY
jgi:hypothetical protein